MGLLRLLLTPSKTQVINGSNITRLNPKMAAHTSLGLLLLLCCCRRCQILQPFWNHNSIDSATFKLSAMPLDLSIHLSTCRMEQDLSSFIKIFFKIQRPLQLQRKNNADEKCDRACFFTKKIPHYVLLFVIGKTRSYFVASNDEKLDDLEVSTKYC